LIYQYENEQMDQEIFQCQIHRINPEKIDKYRKHLHPVLEEIVNNGNDLSEFERHKKILENYGIK
jgi:hypothetical protein